MLGAGVLISMPLNALKGIEATAVGVVGDYKTGKRLRLSLSGGLRNDVDVDGSIDLSGGERIGRQVLVPQRY